MQPRRILVVTDERLSGSFRQTLEKRGFVVVVAVVGSDLNQDLLTSQFDLIVVDIDAGQGANFIRQVRKAVRWTATPVLALGSWGTGQPMLAVSAGADAYEPTPIDATRLVDAVERILNKRAAFVGMGE